MIRMTFSAAGRCALFTTGLLLACSNTSESPSGSAEVPGRAGNPYELVVRAPEKAQVGQEATTEVVVTPGSGFKINVEYPAKLVLGTVPQGTKVAASTVTKGQMTVEKTRLVVPVRFTPEAPGELRFEGELRFSVCTEESCQMPREAVVWTTLAEAAGQ